MTGAEAVLDGVDALRIEGELRGLDALVDSGGGWGVGDRPSGLDRQSGASGMLWDAATGGGDAFGAGWDSPGAVANSDWINLTVGFLVE